MFSRPGFVRSRGFTLVEILVALTLTLMLMSVVVRVFGGVGDGIRKSRAALEQFDRQRAAVMQLKDDLKNITARPDGRPGRPEEGGGYLEIVEDGYNFANTTTNPPSYGVTDTGAADYTVGEHGDMIMFTVRNATRPFVGRFGYANGAVQTVQSDVAEVCWFLRGNRLHRRVLLVVPGAAATIAGTNKNTFYNDYDVSAHLVNGQIVPNSLSDLTKRENRFGHNAGQFPFDVRGWAAYGLPTLAECTSPTWMAGWSNGSTPPPVAGPYKSVDMWDNSAAGSLNTNYPDQILDSNQDGLRLADDVILNNVIEFDIKVWEPAANNGQGAYVDLGSTYTASTGAPAPAVSIAPGKSNSYQPALGPGFPRLYNMPNITVNGKTVGCCGGIAESGLSGAGTLPCVYDTGCFSYFNELGSGQMTNGTDDDADGVVDDLSEAILPKAPALPNGYQPAPGVLPYPVPLRGIQIKIRCFEPASRQIREITIENDFVPR